MDKLVTKYSGINPGAILERQLKKQNLRQNSFAKAISVPAQTLNAIIKGRRKMTPEIALKIDHALGLEESTMGILQACYETKLIRNKLQANFKPDTSKLRRILFWDTDFDQIDWRAQRVAVIQRVWERGNEDEKETIRKFYGNEQVASAIEHQRVSRSHPSAARKSAK
jgi:addiction module HigA family antidote